MNLDNKYPKVVKAIEKFNKELEKIKYAGYTEITIVTEPYQHRRDNHVLPETSIAQNIVIKFRVFDKGEYSEEDE